MQCPLFEPEEDSNKRRKHQHQQKDRERRARINDGLRELTIAVQRYTPHSPTKLDQSSVIAASVSVVKMLENELAEARTQLQLNAQAHTVHPVTQQVHSESKNQNQSSSGSSHEALFNSLNNTVLSNVDVGVMVLRADHFTVISANDTIAKLLGYGNGSSLIGVPFLSESLLSRLCPTNSAVVRRCENGSVPRPKSCCLNGGPLSCRNNIANANGIASSVPSSSAGLLNMNGDANSVQLVKTALLNRLKSGGGNGLGSPCVKCIWVAQTADKRTLVSLANVVLVGAANQILLCTLPKQHRYLSTSACAIALPVFSGIRNTVTATGVGGNQKLSGQNQSHHNHNRGRSFGSFSTSPLSSCDGAHNSFCGSMQSSSLDCSSMLSGSMSISGAADCACSSSATPCPTSITNIASSFSGVKLQSQLQPQSVATTISKPLNLISTTQPIPSAPYCSTVMLSCPETSVCADGPGDDAVCVCETPCCVSEVASADFSTSTSVSVAPTWSGSTHPRRRPRSVTSHDTSLTVMDSPSSDHHHHMLEHVIDHSDHHHHVLEHAMPQPLSDFALKDCYCDFPEPLSSDYLFGQAHNPGLSNDTDHHFHHVLDHVIEHDDHHHHVL